MHHWSTVMSSDHLPTEFTEHPTVAVFSSLQSCRFDRLWRGRPSCASKRRREVSWFPSSALTAYRAISLNERVIGPGHKGPKLIMCVDRSWIEPCISSSICTMVHDAFLSVWRHTVLDEARSPVWPTISKDWHHMVGSACMSASKETRPHQIMRYAHDGIDSTVN